MTAIVFLTLSPTVGEAFMVLADISVLLVLTPYIFAAVSVSYYIQQKHGRRSLSSGSRCSPSPIAWRSSSSSAGTAVAISMALGLATAPLFRAFLAFSKPPALASETPK